MAARWLSLRKYHTSGKCNGQQEQNKGPEERNECRRDGCHYMYKKLKEENQMRDTPLRLFACHQPVAVAAVVAASRPSFVGSTTKSSECHPETLLVSSTHSSSGCDFSGLLLSIFQSTTRAAALSSSRLTCCIIASTLSSLLGRQSFQHDHFVLAFISPLSSAFSALACPALVITRPNLVTSSSRPSVSCI